MIRDYQRRYIESILEQTQDIDRAVVYGYSFSGVFRIIRDDQAPPGSLATMQRAPELSEGLK